MVIVFGAAGFIGTYLVDQLVTDGFDVLATDISQLGEAYYEKQGIAFIRLDITKEKGFTRLPQAGVSAAINLACVQPANVSKEEYDPTDYIKVNVLGTLNILEFCRKTGIQKMIYISSHRTVQALWESGKRIREDVTKAIKYTGEYTMFSISEGAAEDCVEHYRQQYGMQGIIFRLPPVYGYGPHTEIFKNGKPIKTGFKVFIENAIAGKPIEVWGDYEKGRDIIYVKDVVSAIVLALKNKDASGLYNIASGRTLSLKEEAETIARVFSSRNNPSKITYQPDKPNSVEPFLYNISKAKRELRWSPKYSFEEMLVDYKKEMGSGRFKFLLEKRRRMIRRKKEEGR
jgi:UDP-glucose 4-epimerase